MSTIDDYTKLEKIGEGTYGVVYKVNNMSNILSRKEREDTLTANSGPQ